jgi:glycosyltransferase involved in cell wall biosynthesis
MSENLRIVVCSLEPWDEVWRRNQYLVDSLLREDPQLEVLFVEPPADPLHALTRRHRPRRGRGLRVVEGYQGRLSALQPTKLLPRQLGGLADALLLLTVRRVARRLRWRDPRLWINDPGWFGLVKSSGWRALYDITDDWVEADRGQREHDRLVAADTELLASCDEVVVCSPALARSKGGARTVTLIRNAVEVARYRQHHERPRDLPDAPVALYAGTLHEDRLDVDLVIDTAQRMSETGGRLVLLGPNALTPHNTGRLSAHPAVIILGARPRDAVPAYLQYADALIVPHIVDDFTDSLDPIKLYEYLAIGRPVISTGVAGFRDESDKPGVVVAESEEFVAAVMDAIAEWVPTRRHEGVPDWSDRGLAMRGVIDRLGEGRDG